MDNMIFLAIDADNAGRLVGRAVLADDTQGLTDISAKIDHGQEIILSWAQTVGGQRISSGGDEATVSVPPDAVQDIEILRKDYEHATGLTITVGVGQSLSQAGKALMAGKFRGKNQVCQYDDSVESDLVAAGKNVEAGQGSEEENKLNEQYLQKEEPVADDHSHENCQYCQEYDAKHGVGKDSLCDCPYCKEYDAKMAQDHSHDNCPYCQQYDAQQAAGPGSDCNCPYCQQYDAEQAAGAQAPGASSDQVPSPAGNDMQPMAAPPDQNGAIAPQPNKPVLGGDPAGVGIESSPQDMPPTAGLNSTGMIDNASHPQGYDANTPGDMGLAENEVPEAQPDLSQVLQGGLDQQAGSIQKEKLGQMIGQALEKIKGQKALLEKAKEQAPDLYNGVIMMMKSMIEMAKMLGFGQEVQGDQGAQPAQAAAPAPAAAPQEGAAPAPKGMGQ